MSAVGLATLGVQCRNNRALCMASLGTFSGKTPVFNIAWAMNVNKLLSRNNV